MTVSPNACAHSAMASVVRPLCSGSSNTPVVHVRPTSWYPQGRALLIAYLVTLAVFPSFAYAAPPTLRPVARVAIQPRQGPGSQGNGGGPNDGSISMNVWLPILLVTIVFVLFSFVTCIRRCAAVDAAAEANRAANAAARADGTTRSRRRPRRTPSQISTKSLPPYMKEPGDQELVLFRGPQETEDDTAPPQPMPTLAEDENEYLEMRAATFDIALDRVETVDTMADSSTTNLMHGVPRPPELPRPTAARDRRSGDGHSVDSVESDAELLAGHLRVVSVDTTEPMGEAPPYSETVAAEGGMTTISLNDPEPSAAGRGRSRFSFLTQNPFGSHNRLPSNATRSESPALHVRTGSALSRISTHESHDSHHSRTPSRNIARSHSRSNSNLMRVFRSHSPGLHAGSSTISLDSISAPLTHTVTRAEFHAPKGGLLTPQQVKLITSREGLERFGIPYGPDAVAAFSLSRERVAGMGPPPDFESVAGSGSGGSGSEPTLDGDAVLARSTFDRTVERGGSRSSTIRSYETAPESDGDASQMQVVQMDASGDEMDEADDPRTARPMTPRTARLSGTR